MFRAGEGMGAWGEGEGKVAEVRRWDGRLEFLKPKYALAQFIDGCHVY